MHAEMLQHALKAMNMAYAPHSNFKVGACIRDNKGNLFQGCNMENASYGLTICAERSACCSMISSLGKQSLESVLIVCADKTCITPCGACLQVLTEFSTTETMVTCAYGESYEQSKTWRLSELIPHAFSL